MCYLQTIFKSILMNLIRFFRLPVTTHLERRKTRALENISPRIDCYRKKLSCKTANYATTKTITRNVRKTSVGPKLPNLARRSLKSSSIKPYQKHIEDHSSRGLHTHAHIIRVDTDKTSSSPMRMQRPRKSPG